MASERGEHAGDANVIFPLDTEQGQRGALLLETVTIQRVVTGSVTHIKDSGEVRDAEEGE